MQLFRTAKTTTGTAGIISGCTDLPEVRQAREAENRVAELTAGLARIDGAIADAETTLAGLEVRPMPEIERERGDLAAAVALGEQPDGAIEEFDRKAAKSLAAAQQERMRIEGQRRQVTATMKSLQQRRQTAANELEELTTALADRRADALRAVATKLLESYVKTAREFMEGASALTFLSDRHRRQGGNGFALGEPGFLTGTTMPIFDVGNGAVDELRHLASLVSPFGSTDEHEHIRAELSGALANLGLAV